MFVNKTMGFVHRKMLLTIKFLKKCSNKLQCYGNEFFLIFVSVVLIELKH